MHAPLPWPSVLTDSPSVTVIERAITRQRLSHSLLLTGGDLSTLVGVAHAIADRLLNPPGYHHFAVKEHPDYRALRPRGKTRIIPIGKADSPEPGTMREFIPKLYVAPSIAPHKVGIIYEADRMNVESSNAFLKTLEEPPPHTTLILITTRPYSLLTTIRSRCLHFRFPAPPALLGVDGWSAWITDYTAWLARLCAGITDKRSAADSIMAVYGLIARFAAVLDYATTEVWKEQKAKIPDDLSKEEQEAIETGIANGLRARLFIEIEHATRTFALPRLRANDAATNRALTAAVDKLEQTVGLLRLNLNESAALEEFLLSSLRFWTRK